MNPRSIINLVKRFTRQYGVKITWLEPSETLNSRGVVVGDENDNEKSAIVLLLKERFNPLDPRSAVMGLTQDYTRYILTLPEIKIAKDVIITDNHGMKWKVGIVDWIDIGGTTVYKQASITEVA